jgi:hypothetical protein
MNLPDWMPETLWDEWVAYRQDDLKKPASERSQKMTLKRLDRLRATHCPIKLIEIAIEREWRGIYPTEEAKYAADIEHSEFSNLSAAERVKAKIQSQHALRVVAGDGGSLRNSLDKIDG